MPFDRLAATKGHTFQISAIVSVNDVVRQPPIPPHLLPVISTIDLTYWRTYDYCAAIIRLYASLERFILDVVGDWIRWVSNADPSRFTDSVQLIDRYTLGVSEILRRRREDRFSGIKPGELGESLAALHAKGDISSLEVEAFYAGLPNLKLRDLLSLLAAVEIQNASKWVLNFGPLVAFCRASNTTIEALLKDLVDRRNEAAHGNELPADVLGLQPLKDLANFVDYVCTAVSELVFERMTTIAIDGDGRANAALLGTVEHVYSKSNACVIRSAGNPMSVGMNVIARAKDRCRPSKITSIQLENVPHQNVSPNNGELVGLQLPVNPGRGTALYRLEGIPSIDGLLDWAQFV